MTRFLRPAAPARSTRLRLEGLEVRDTPATLTVTTLNDAGVGSLRNMIDLANATPEADTVVFDAATRGNIVNLTTYVDPPANEFAGPTALIVSGPTTIEGTGETITRPGSNAFRLFQVLNGGSLTLRNVTLSNGLALGGYGSPGGGGGAGLGGAVYNQGALNVFDCTFNANRAVGGAAGTTEIELGDGGGGLSARRPASVRDGQGPNGGVAGGAQPGFGGGGAGRVGLGSTGQTGGFGGGGGGGSGGFGGGDGGFGAGGGGGGTSGGGGFAGFGGGRGGDTGGPGGGGAGLGGAVFNQGGFVVVANSTFAGNLARGGISEGVRGAAGAGQSGGAYGGALFNLNGTVYLDSVTVAGNTVSTAIGDGKAHAVDGGALYNLARNAGTATVSQNASVYAGDSVFADTAGGSDVVNDQTNGTARLAASGPDLAATAVVNLGGVATGPAFTVADAKLGPVASNGGPTQTRLPLPGSPALDAGDNARVNAGSLGSPSPFHDQRGPGFVRISNARVDLGAVEVQVPVTIAPAALPAGQVGAAYNQTLTAGGPAGPFAFGEAFGPLAPPNPPTALPPGLTLAPAGVIAGTPTTAVTYTFTVRAINATDESANRTYTVAVGSASTVPPAVPPVVPPAVPPGSRPPVPVLVGGPTDGSARLLTSIGGTLSLGSPLSLLPGLGAAARVAVADVTGDGVPDRVAGAGPGAASRVTVFDGVTGATLSTFLAFEASFTGGVFVAAADIDGDGEAEVVVTPDESGGPVVAIYSGAKLAAGLGGEAAQAARFFGIAGDPNFRGGARPALADVNRDGAADLVVSAGVSGGPRIALFDGKSVLTGAADPRRLLPDFFAFENTLRNGAFVAAGDVTGDRFADLAFGGGPGGAPRVRLFDGAALLAAGAFSTLDAAPAAQRANFFAGDPSLRGGVRLALTDADGDGRADLVTGSGAGEASRVRVYPSAALLAGGAAGQEFDPFAGAALAGGVFVG